MRTSKSLVAGLLAGALLLSACSSGDGGSDGATTTKAPVPVDVEQVLQGLADDVIVPSYVQLSDALTERGIERGVVSYVLAAESIDTPIVGRLVDRGLDDELKGTAYAVVDGVDGRTHHIKLPHLDAAGDSPPGSIVGLCPTTPSPSTTVTSPSSSRTTHVPGASENDDFTSTGT